MRSFWLLTFLALTHILNAEQDSWNQVSAGARHTCGRVKANHCHGDNACSKKGSIECFGDNRFGQASPPKGTFAKLSAGRDSTCAIRTDGSITCWGNENNPVVTSAPLEYGFETISVGGSHACALKQKKLFCWGSNDYEQITPPEEDSEYSSVTCGTDHTCGILLNGYVVCWGQDGNKESSGYPPDVRFTQVSCGTGHSCGLTIQRQVMCWGRNNEGQSTVPSKNFKSEEYYSKVDAGHRHTCAVRDSARSADAVICWGSNYAGESRARFRGEFVDVSSGAQHSCGLTSTGDIRCWGSNTYGQSRGRTTMGVRGSG